MNVVPLPQGQGSLRPTLAGARCGSTCGFCCQSEKDVARVLGVAGIALETQQRRGVRRARGAGRESHCGQRANDSRDVIREELRSDGNPWPFSPLRRTARLGQKMPRTLKNDPYLDVVYRHWASIVMMYERFADKRPVMLFDIQEQRIYVLPCAAYCAELSQRSQASLKEQYAQAVANGDVVVFVRDNQQEKLVSFSLPLATPPSRTSRTRRGAGVRRARKKG